MATITAEDGGALRYTRVAIWLHWLIAGFLIFNLATGLTFEKMPDALFDALVPLHISSGITVLALTAVRIAWRLTHRPPPMLPMPTWQRHLAKTVYVLFYVGMVVAPMTGWALVSAHPSAPPAVAKPGEAPVPAPHATMIWGIVPLPRLAPIVHIGDGPGGAAKLHEAHEQFEARHGTIGWILLGLLVLHVTGAMKHQLVDRRRELARMGL
jgi:cytochrome b561